MGLGSYKLRCMLSKLLTFWAIRLYGFLATVICCHCAFFVSGTTGNFFSISTDSTSRLDKLKQVSSQPSSSATTTSSPSLLYFIRNAVDSSKWNSLHIYFPKSWKDIAGGPSDLRASRRRVRPSESTNWWSFQPTMMLDITLL